MAKPPSERPHGLKTHQGSTVGACPGSKQGKDPPLHPPSPEHGLPCVPALIPDTQLRWTVFGVRHACRGRKIQGLRRRVPNVADSAPFPAPSTSLTTTPARPHVVNPCPPLGMASVVRISRCHGLKGTQCGAGATRLPCPALVGSEFVLQPGLWDYGDTAAISTVQCRVVSCRGVGMGSVPRATLHFLAQLQWTSARLWPLPRADMQIASGTPTCNDYIKLIMTSTQERYNYAL